MSGPNSSAERPSNAARLDPSRNPAAMYNNPTPLVIPGPAFPLPTGAYPGPNASSYRPSQTQYPNTNGATLMHHPQPFRMGQFTNGFTPVTVPDYSFSGLNGVERYRAYCQATGMPPLALQGVNDNNDGGIPPPSSAMGYFANGMAGVNMSMTAPPEDPVPTIPGFNEKKKPVIVYSPGTGPTADAKVLPGEVNGKIAYKSFKDRSFKECTFTNCTYDMCLPLDTSTTVRGLQAVKREYENCDFVGCSFQNCTHEMAENGICLKSASNAKETRDLLWGTTVNNEEGMHAEEDEEEENEDEQGVMTMIGGWFDGVGEMDVDEEPICGVCLGGEFDPDVFSYLTLEEITSLHKGYICSTCKVGHVERLMNKYDWEWVAYQVNIDKNCDDTIVGCYTQGWDTAPDQWSLEPMGIVVGYETDDETSSEGTIAWCNEAESAAVEGRNGFCVFPSSEQSDTIGVPARGGRADELSEVPNTPEPTLTQVVPLDYENETPQEERRKGFSSQSYGPTSVANPIKAPPSQTPTPFETNKGRPTSFLETPHGLSPPRQTPAPSIVQHNIQTTPLATPHQGGVRYESLGPNDSCSVRATPPPWTPADNKPNPDNSIFSERLRRIDANHEKEMKEYLTATKSDKVPGTNKTKAWLEHDSVAALARNPKNEEEILRDVEVQHLLERKAQGYRKSGGGGGQRFRLSQADTEILPEDNTKTSGRKAKKTGNVAKQETTRVKMKDRMQGKILKAGPSQMSGPRRGSHAHTTPTSTEAVDKDSSQLADDEMDLDDFNGGLAGGGSPKDKAYEKSRKNMPGYFNPNLNKTGGL